jgi:hypothetical protein
MATPDTAWAVSKQGTTSPRWEELKGRTRQKSTSRISQAYCKLYGYVRYRVAVLLNGKGRENGRIQMQALIRDLTT